MSYRLIATDLDGTLLRSEWCVPARTLDAIAAVQDAGALVVPVTARGVWNTRPIAREFGIEGFAVCNTGALLYDLREARVLDTCVLDPATGLDMVRALRAAAPGVRFACSHETSVSHEPEYEPPMSPPPDTFVGDALSFFDRPVTKLIATHPQMEHPRLLELARTLGEDAAVGTSGPPWVEILASGVTKATFIETLCARYSIARSEVIAFGDMPADAPMLRWAGQGVAVANAHPSALAAADEITASNDEDGVALVLERLLAAGRVACA